MKTIIRIVAAFILINTQISANATWPSLVYYSEALSLKTILLSLIVEILVISLICKLSLFRTISVTILGNAVSASIGWFYLKLDLSPFLWTRLDYFFGIQSQVFSVRDLALHLITIVLLNTMIELPILKLVSSSKRLSILALTSIIANLASTTVTCLIIWFTDKRIV